MSSSGESESDGSASDGSGFISDGDEQQQQHRTTQHGDHREEDDDDMMSLDDDALKELMGTADATTTGSSNNEDNSTSTSSSEAFAPVGYNYEYTPDNNLSGQKSLTKKQLERVQTIEVAVSNVRKVIEKYGNAPLPSLNPNDYNIIDSDSDDNNKEFVIDPNSAWADTSAAMEEIVDAREEMIKAWQKDDDDDDDDNSSGGNESMEKTEERPKWWKAILDNDNEDDSKETNNYNQNTYKNDGGGEPRLTNNEHEEFQSIHMEWATNAFAEELEALRMGQLEQLCNTRKQQKKKGVVPTATTATTGGAAGADVDGGDNHKSAIELDPTQYSFVVASKNKKGAVDSYTAVEDIDVQVMADMLSSGSNFLSNIEKKMLLNARQRAVAEGATAGGGGTKRGNNRGSKGVVGNTNGLTLHERRKQELGFLVVE